MSAKVMSFLGILLILGTVNARIHKLVIQGDTRNYIELTTFGFYTGGILTVNLTNFHVSPFDENALFGFSLDRTLRDAMNPYLDTFQEKCLLEGISTSRSETDQKDASAVIYFTMDFKKQLLKVDCSHNMRAVHISSLAGILEKPRAKRHQENSNHTDFLSTMQKRESAPQENDVRDLDEKDERECTKIELPMKIETIKGEKYLNTSFVMHVINKEEEGLYNLYFHSCPNYDYRNLTNIDFTLHIKESNGDNFLSAGEMPLPTLYFMMSVLFFLSGCFWIYILKKSIHPVFKIHYLMAVLVYLKSLSLLFHGINYHFIETKGEHVAAWAILYYITHLLKGAVLFITIVLVGTGWDFIKHILSDKDKKIFMIVIPLQVLANVAEIIIEESEEGDIEHNAWRNVFILVDLLCCGAILFPVAWSIRHLQEPANVDGKAAIHLQKLKLFRHFYTMIVCYIYFSRIIVYLLKMTVPFQYEWLDEMFREMATYMFFSMTGYKFRPASANPYFAVNDDDLPENEDDDEMDVVISGGSGFAEGLGKVSRATKVRTTTTELSVNNEERDSLIHKREASHDYD